MKFPFLKSCPKHLLAVIVPLNHNRMHGVDGPLHIACGRSNIFTRTIPTVKLIYTAFTPRGQFYYIFNYFISSLWIYVCDDSQTFQTSSNRLNAFGQAYCTMNSNEIRHIIVTRTAIFDSIIATGGILLCTVSIIAKCKNEYS